jgi:hypothetical protein
MMRGLVSLGVCLLVGGSMGCSGSDKQAPGGAAAGEASSTSGTSGTTGTSGASHGGDTLDAPDEADALVSFLEAEQYASWAKEAEAHASAGPHGKSVRTYYSPKAAEALNSGAETFPAGAASVKELTSDGSVYGYSVWVKVQDATDSGNGFFWYELVHHDGADDTVYGNSRGSSACVGCHSAGKDYWLSTLPFE